MKIAVLLSGMPRYVERGYDLTKGIYKGHDVDFFCHAWFDKSKTVEEKSWHNKTITTDPNVDEKILKTYNPKNYLFEKQRQFEVPRPYNYNTSWPQPFFIVFSHFYSVKTANLLRKIYEKETNTKYDLVLKMRYDIAIGNKINWKEYDLNNLYIHDNCNMWSDLHDELSFNDMIAFSKPENMDVYCNTFDLIDKIYMENQIRFSCECFLGYNLINNNINVVPIDFSRAFMLREDYTHDITQGIKHDLDTLEKYMAHYD
jgi:hypothetical protein